MQDTRINGLELEENVETLFKVEPPLTPAPSNYGYIGVLLRNKETDKIQCHVCGKWFLYFAPHLVKHNMNTDEYKIKFGLPMRFPLSSRNLSSKRSLSAIKNNPGRKYYWEKALSTRKVMEKNKEWKKEYRKKIKRSKTCAAYQNSVGSCKDQLLSRYMIVADKIGRNPSQKDLLINDTSLMGIIQRRYKTINNFRKINKLEVYKSPKRWTEELLLSWLVKAKDVLKRIPTPRDFGNNKDVYKFDNNAPYYQSYFQRFGSWSRVLQMAGFIKQ